MRELENAIERAVLVCKTGEIAPTICRRRFVRRESGAGVHDSAAPDAGRNREDGDRADAAADELEQAGGGADPRPLSADALQQDEEARHQGSARGAARGGRLGQSDIHQARFNAARPLHNDSRPCSSASGALLMPACLALGRRRRSLWRARRLRRRCFLLTNSRKSARQVFRDRLAFRCR